MNCPFCRSAETRVVDSRSTEDGTAIRRRRLCPSCGKRFTTVETMSILVVKRSGVVEPFSREKVVSGVRKACQGRPVSEDDLALLAQQVEDQLRSSGMAAIASHDVGLAILGPLRALDEVAYLRFASVYRSFESLADFEAEITLLRAASPSDADSLGLPAGRQELR
jgi:transcriptional repressor NrdR